MSIEQELIAIHKEIATAGGLVVRQIVKRTFNRGSSFDAVEKLEASTKRLRALIAKTQSRG